MEKKRMVRIPHKMFKSHLKEENKTHFDTTTISILNTVIGY
jgi:hypothetical protein